MNIRQEDVGFKRTLPLQPGNTFTRLLTANVVSRVLDENLLATVRRLWPSDRVMLEMVTRATSAPAITDVTGWAAELVQTLVVDMISVLSGVSSGAELLRRGLVVSDVKLIPGLVVDATAASFVVEGSPIPVRQMALTTSTLDSFKLATIAVLTREMLESSNAEALISEALTRAAGLALDAALFDSNAATTARPAGLRNGIAAITASNNADFNEAFIIDLAALIGAVATVGGAGPYVLIMSPARATLVNVRFLKEASPPVIVLGSTAVGNDVIAVAPAAVAASLGPVPDIETAKAATLHMDTVPVAVGSAGSHKSMFQTDSMAIKMRWPVSWILRNTAGVAWLTPTWK